ncbi:MAG: hypothetical protein IPK80_07160 [Nannocystis sp.]|nr:hypothetical protein [Nannocystis sp.]
MDHTQRTAISRLFAAIFGGDNEELLRCLRAHPAVDTPFLSGLPPAAYAVPATFQWKVIERLTSFGLVDRGLFDALLEARPGAGAQIEAAARLFGVEIRGATRPPADRVIMMMCADTDEAAPLRLVQEQRAVLDAIAAAPAPRPTVLLEPQISYLGAVRALALRRPSIGHFGGHGRPGGQVVFADGAVSPASMAEIFRGLEAPPELVVFLCCDSAAMAAAVSQHVAYTIGFDGPLDDARAAPAFAAALYGLWADGSPIPRAFTLALHTAAASDASAGLARLYGRGGVLLA